MSDNYILDGKNAVPCGSVYEWARWFEKADRSVKKTQLPGDVMVSTVFLAIDHRFGGLGMPILFETMVFGGPMNQEMDRYSTWEDAEKGHDAMVKKVKEAGR